MFLHDIVSDLTAEEARKSFKRPIKENDDDLFAADRKTADPWVTHYIGNPIVGYARIIPDLHSRWKYDPEDLHPEEQKFYHMAGQRVPVMDWSERTHFAVIMIGAAHPLRVKTWMLDNVDIDLSLRQQDNDDDELAESDDDLFAVSDRLTSQKLFMLANIWATASRQDQLKIENDMFDQFGYVISRLEGPYVAAGDYHYIELYNDSTGSVLYFTDRNGVVEPSRGPNLDHLAENDDDLFANRIVINPVSLARGIVQVAEEFEDRADRVSTWAADKSYRDDAAILRFAARACKSGLRACMKELSAIDDANTWDYIIEVLQQDFDIDLSRLYDQYENGELTESVEEPKSDDDLFSDRSTLVTPKTIATGVDYAVDGWLDRAHDPVNHRRIEIGYEGTKVVTEFLKGMVPGLRAWYQLDDELRDDIAASIKDDVDIDLYALYDSLPPINEESDDDLFADRTDVSDIVDAIDEVADHWGKLGPSVKEDDPDWYHLANMLHDAAVEFKLHGVMQGMRALARIDVWEALADSLEFLGFDEVWTKIEQYIDHLNEAADDPDITQERRSTKYSK
jgi:hypothetical protein